jgi:integrase
MLLKKFAEDYCRKQGVRANTRVTYLGCVRAIEKWAKRPLTLVAAAESVNDFIYAMLPKKSQYTVAGYRRHLGVLLRSAVQEHGIRLGKIRKVKLQQLMPAGFTNDELLSLLAHATPRQRAAILVAYDTGFRRTDVFLARRDRIERRGDKFVISHVISKNGRVESRELTPKTISAIEAAQVESAREGDVYYVCKRAGVVVEKRCVTVEHQRQFCVPWGYGMQTWKRQWLALGKRAGVDVRRRGLQAIRRTGASLVCKEHGAYEAARHLGHAESSGVAVFTAYYRVPGIVGDVPSSPPAFGG